MSRHDQYQLSVVFEESSLNLFAMNQTRLQFYELKPIIGCQGDNEEETLKIYESRKDLCFWAMGVATVLSLALSAASLGVAIQATQNSPPSPPPSPPPPEPTSKTDVLDDPYIVRTYLFRWNATDVLYDADSRVLSMTVDDGYSGNVRMTSKDKYNSFGVNGSSMYKFTHVDPETGVSRTFEHEGGRVDTSIHFTYFEHLYARGTMRNAQSGRLQHGYLNMLMQTNDSDYNLWINKIHYTNATGFGKVTIGIAAVYNGHSQIVEGEHHFDTHVKMFGHKNVDASFAKFSVIGTVPESVPIWAVPCGVAYWALVLLKDILIAVVFPEEAVEGVAEEVEEEEANSVIKSVAQSTSREALKATASNMIGVPGSVAGLVATALEAIAKWIGVTGENQLMAIGTVGWLIASVIMNPMGTATNTMIATGLTWTCYVCWPRDFKEEAPIISITSVLVHPEHCITDFDCQSCLEQCSCMDYPGGRRLLLAPP